MHLRARILLLVAIATLAPLLHAQTAGPQAAIDSGALQGLRVASLPRGGAFLGIPFAAPPIGDLRWRAPQPVPHWQGVHVATQFGPACPQLPSPWLPEMLGIRAMPTSESCLDLNVWTPDLHPQTKLPVFVWVHGGGNLEGSGEWPPLGVTLAQQGIVVVSFNYRLGVFGFLADPSLAAESSHHASGNYGHLDQLAALRWVRQNIRSFGGDPDRITIGGQSSGALDVCNLMASPLARGLFHGAILQSGVCTDSVYPTAAELNRSGAQLAADLHIPRGAATLQALRAIPAERLLDAAAHDPDIDLEPNIDGWVLPQQPALAFAHGAQLAIPVLVGTNQNEVSIFASPIVGGKSWRPATVAAYRAWLQKKFGPLAAQVFSEYPAHRDSEARAAFEAMDTDFDFAFGAWLVAKDTAQSGQPAWLYNFTYAGPGKFAPLGAFHSEESMFLSRKYWTSWTPRPSDRPLSDAIIRYWAQFVKTGDPNQSGLPHWPACDPAHPQSQQLDRRIAPEPVPHLNRFAVFQHYLDSRLAKTAH